MKTKFSEIMKDIFIEMKHNALFHILNIIIHLAILFLMTFVSTLFISWFNEAMQALETTKFVSSNEYIRAFIPILNEVVDYLIVLLLCSPFITNLAFGTMDIIQEGGINLNHLITNLIQTFLKSFSVTLWMGITLVPITSIAGLLMIILEKMITNQVVLAIIALILILIVFYQILKYMYVYFVLADNEQSSAVQICHTSKEIFRKSKTFLFSVTIIIGFITWGLSKCHLGLFLLVIMMIILPMFINILFAKVYMMLK